MKELWEDIKYDFEWHYNDLRSKVKSIVIGLSNFWKFRKEIYNYRWWDYSISIHNPMKAILKDMYKNWDNSHYIGSEKEKQTLKELIDILEEIERLEDSCSYDEKRIDELYQKFGRKLFDIKGEYKVPETGKIIYRESSSIRKLWD
jgi:hypothetical protein